MLMLLFSQVDLYRDAKCKRLHLSIGILTLEGV